MVTRELVPGSLWVLDEPLRFMGVECGRRMTVVRLPSGALWVHSPSRLDPAATAWLASLGEPRYFVCPNRVHDAHIECPFAVYPDAEVYAPPGTSASYQGLPFRGVLGDRPEPAWADAIDQTIFPGPLGIAEAVMCHRASGSLILADVCFNVGAEASAGMRLVARAFGMYGKLAASMDLRLALRDRPGARRAVERILAWEFDRVIVGHGAVLEHGGHAAFARAFAWLS